MPKGIWIGIMHSNMADIFEWDAAYLLLIFIAVEKEFGITITDAEACEITTLEELIKIIRIKQVK